MIYLIEINFFISLSFIECFILSFIDSLLYSLALSQLIPQINHFFIFSSFLSFSSLFLQRFIEFSPLSFLSSLSLLFFDVRSVVFGSYTREWKTRKGKNVEKNATRYTYRACIDGSAGDLYVFLRTAGGCDAGIICHTRLETGSITKARVPSRAQSIRNRYIRKITRTVCITCWKTKT